MRPSLGISVAFLRPLSELLGRLEEDPQAFLASLDVDDGMAPDAYVAAELVDGRVQALAEKRGDPALSLALARVAAARPLGLFGHLVWLSGNVRDALTRATKFYAMVSRRTRLSLEDLGDGTAAVRQTPLVKVRRGRVLTEFPFASLAVRARETTGGKFRFREVRFAHAGEDTPAYAEVFGAPVTFGAAVDEVVFDATMLDLPLASTDPITSAAIEANIARTLEAAATTRSPLLDRVRRAVDKLDGTPTLTAVAKSIGLSARTLRRRLEEDGQSLRAVIEDVRRERADELLGAGTPVKEVAFALGFSEPSAFSRAYKRWTGRAPRLGR